MRAIPRRSNHAKPDQNGNVADSARQSDNDCADQSKRGIVGRARNQIVSSLRAQEMRLIDAPIGHRQPYANDVPSVNASDLEHIGAEDVAVDRNLIICRGC